MPTKTYTLSQGDTPETLTVKWGYNWKNLTVLKDGAQVGLVPNSKELLKGQSFSLPDGRMITVQLKGLGFNPALEILLDGTPVPGSGTDPQEQVKTAVHVLYFIAGFNLLLGNLAEVGQVEFLLELGLGLGAIIIGVINLVLAYLVKTKHSVLALYLAIGLIVLDLIFSLVYSAENGGSPIAGLFIKIIFISMLFGGTKALKKLNENKAPAGI